MKGWDERAHDVLAQGCVTYSCRSDQFVRGVYPTHLQGGSGCHVIDSAGKGYVDWMGGLGSAIFNNNNRWGLPTTAEVECAEMVRERIPICEKLKILKTGSEACQASVRIARAWQQNAGRAQWYKGIGSGYHGHHNWCIAAEKPGTGCVDEYYTKVSDEVLIDAVKHGAYSYCIVEPVTLDISDERKAWLEALRAACTVNNTVLIFDEVITGMRVPGYCVANHFGIQPDLICLGKAFADGAPFAVVGGRRELMDTPGYFVSSTFAGELSGLTAAIATMLVMQPDVIRALWERGRYFQEQFNALSTQLKLVGIPTKAVFAGDERYKNIFWQEMCRRGYLFGKAWHISMAHTWGIIEETLEACKLCIEYIDGEHPPLAGDMAQEVFKRHDVK